MTGPVSGSWRMFREAGLGPCQFRPRVVDGDAAGHIDEGNPGSDAQPSPGQCNLGCNLHPDSAAFTRTGQQLSRPVEDCAECPALAGVRDLGLDDPSPDRPVLHCNFGGALSALSVDTGFSCVADSDLSGQVRPFASDESAASSRQSGRLWMPARPCSDCSEPPISQLCIFHVPARTCRR